NWTVSPRQTPEPNRAILAAGHRAAAIRRECHAPDAERVPRKAVQFRARLHVPQAQGVIVVTATRQGALPIWRQRQPQDVTAVPRKAPHFLARLRIPKAQQAVATS